MVTEDYVSRETYKLLKEKGYDGEFKTCYDTEGYTCPAIHLYDAMKWLREVHHIAIQIFPVFAKDTWCFDVYKKDDKGIWKSEPENLSDIDFGLYEECLNAALVYTLENLV